MINLGGIALGMTWLYSLLIRWIKLSEKLHDANPQRMTTIQKCKNHLSGKEARPLEARRRPSIGFVSSIWFAADCCWWFPRNLACWQLFTKLSWLFIKLLCWLFTKWLFWVEICICCFWQNVSASTLRFAFARRFWNQILIWNENNGLESLLIIWSWIGSML